MDALINFIKEALAGKKMSAEWIVTLAIAIAGIAWGGTLAYQKYEGMQSAIAELQGSAHEKTEAYDDAPMSARVTTNSAAIIAATERLKAVEAGLEKLSTVREKLERIEAEVKNLDRNVERATSNGNPLAL